MTSIAILGIGLMGDPMARCLLKAGLPVTVWNRTPAKAEALAAVGAHVAADPTDAVAGAEVVITMLTDQRAVAAALLTEPVLAALQPGAVVIDMSSIPPAAAREHATRLAERNVQHLDAPVSGGTRGAAEGKLAIMVGGDREVFERCQPVFASLGRATWVGPSGAGQVAKLANQVIVALTIDAVSEALLLAAAGGADPAAVRDAIRGGFAESRILAEHGERMLARDFRPGGTVAVQTKDLDNALDAARDAGVQLPVTAVVRDLFRQLRDSDGAGFDHSALLLALERLSPPHRVGTTPDTLPD